MGVLCIYGIANNINFMCGLLANKYFVNRFGGSKFGEYAALIGVVIGCFVLPPFGIIIIPFILVFIVELIQGYSFERAVKVSIGSIVAFLTSSIAQAIIMFIMIVWFFIDALLIINKSLLQNMFFGNCNLVILSLTVPN